MSCETLIYVLQIEFQGYSCNVSLFGILHREINCRYGVYNVPAKLVQVLGELAAIAGHQRFKIRGNVSAIWQPPVTNFILSQVQSHYSTFFFTQPTHNSFHLVSVDNYYSYIEVVSLIILLIKKKRKKKKNKNVICVEWRERTVRRKSQVSVWPRSIIFMTH